MYTNQDPKRKSSILNHPPRKAWTFLTIHSSFAYLNKVVAKTEVQMIVYCAAISSRSIRIRVELQALNLINTDNPAVGWLTYAEPRLPLPHPDRSSIVRARDEFIPWKKKGNSFWLCTLSNSSDGQRLALWSQKSEDADNDCQVSINTREFRDSYL